MSILAVSFWSAVGGGAFVLVLPAGAWLIFRSSITAWLTKRLTARLERDAERYRHELGRDMEGYKDELARTQSIDNFRAEVRKAVAERLFELRLTALHEVHVALSNIPSWVQANMAFNDARPHRNELAKKMTEFLEPVNRNGLYFPGDFLVSYRELGIEMIGIHPEWERNEVVPVDDPRMQSISARAGALGLRVTELHRALPDELAEMIARSKAPTPAA
ncbi:UNVERIFIED_ORG: hypothetical protein BDU10_7450 [Burkholderia sp. CF145]